MGLVSPTQVSDGTTADASDINTPVNQIAAVVNGNIDNSNIAAAAAIDGSKLAANSIDIGAKASVFDGWIAVSDTWTYASATTVTVPSDATTKYSVGDKVKFTNSGAKYFYITAVGATTLTLNGGSDYTVANAAITVPYYSKSETPLGFPQWFNYTPTWTNLTVNTGTVTARFSMSGKTVLGKLSIAFSASTSVAGVVSFSLPIAASASQALQSPGIGVAQLVDSGVQSYGGWILMSTSTLASFNTWDTASTYARTSQMAAAVPFAWGNLDTAAGNFFYEAA